MDAAIERFLESKWTNFEPILQFFDGKFLDILFFFLMYLTPTCICRAQNSNNPPEEFEVPKQIADDSLSILQHNIKQFETQIYEHLKTNHHEQIAEKLKKIMEDFPTDLTTSMMRQSVNEGETSSMLKKEVV